MFNEGTEKQNWRLEWVHWRKLKSQVENDSSVGRLFGRFDVTVPLKEIGL